MRSLRGWDHWDQGGNILSCLNSSSCPLRRVLKTSSSCLTPFIPSGEVLLAMSSLPQDGSNAKIHYIAKKKKRLAKTKQS